MNLKKYLSEEFLGFSKQAHPRYPVYKNPTKTDLSALFKEEINLFPYTYNRMTKEIDIRFVADLKNKDFYIYSSEYLHNDFFEDFLKKKKGKNDEEYFMGIGIVTKPHYQIFYKTSFDFYNLEYAENLELKDLEFMKKYIVNFNDIIDKIKKEYNQYKTFYPKRSFKGLKI